MIISAAARRLYAYLLVLCLVSGAGLARADTPAVDTAAPPLKLAAILQAPEGSKATWKALDGKVVVLEFWATWCGPCVAAIPHLNELAEEFKDQPVQFIAITDENEATVKPFLNKRPMHAWIGIDREKGTFQAYGVRGRPQTVLVDKRGRIALVTHPNQVTAQMLRDVLAGKAMPKVSGGPAIEAGVLPGQTPEDTDNSLLRIVIRPSTSAGGGSVTSQGKMTCVGQSLRSIVTHAYGGSSYSTDWRMEVPETLYDISIALPPQQADRLQPILQNLLREMFGITGTRQVQRRDVLLLTVPERTTPTLTPAVIRGNSISVGNGKAQAVGLTMDGFAANLSGWLGCKVINETGIEGHYDFDLTWDPKDLDSLRKAVRSKYGLQLAAARRDVPILVVQSTREAASQPGDRGPEGTAGR